MTDQVSAVLRARFLAFLRQYANWEQLSAVYFTFDVDFAPDYMIRNVLDILDEEHASATFFVTHRSDLLMDIVRGDRHEVGLHPNLSPDSTQGTSLSEIISDLRRSYPGVVGNRFHLLRYSYRDLAVLGKQGFLYDVSTLRHNCPYTVPAWHRDIGMVLLTYTFEDGICENANSPLTLDSVDLWSPGLKIINFHPLNVYLNGSDAMARKAFLHAHPRLPTCPQRVADRYRRGGDGADKLLRSLLRHLNASGCRLMRLRELAEAYLAAVNGAEQG